MTTALLSPEETQRLKWQRRWGRLAFAAVGPGCVFTMRVIRGNRLEGAEQVRQVYRAALASGRPTFVCANHLTMVDSGFLHWALAPLPEYLMHYERLGWNVPAVEHFHSNPLLRLLLYLGKTVPINRSGDDAHRKQVMEKLRWLASHGEVVVLFPEGTRSRTGRIDPSTVTYGIGQLLKDLERPQVVCCYLRGRRQEGATGVPPWGDTVEIRAELLEPTTTETGLRATRDLSRQVIQKLKAMEDAWLAQRGTNP